jgi:hypothetical protein
MADLLGMNYEVWTIILTAIVVVETLVLIVLTIKPPEKGSGMDPTAARLFTVLEKVIEIPTILDPKRLAFLPHRT